MQTNIQFGEAVDSIVNEDALNPETIEGFTAQISSGNRGWYTAEVEGCIERQWSGALIAGQEGDVETHGA